MKQAFVDKVSQGGTFVENPKNVLVGQYNNFNIIIKKVKGSVYELHIMANRGSQNMKVILELLHGQIGVDRKVIRCIYENSTIKITFKKNGNLEDQIVEYINKCINYLQKNRFSTGCGFCGAGGMHKAYKIKGEVCILCESCYDNYYEVVFGKKLKLKKNKKDKNIINLNKSYAKGAPQNTSIKMVDGNDKKNSDIIPVKKSSSDTGWNGAPSYSVPLQTGAVPTASKVEKPSVVKETPVKGKKKLSPNENVMLHLERLKQEKIQEEEKKNEITSDRSKVKPLKISRAEKKRLEEERKQAERQRIIDEKQREKEELIRKKEEEKRAILEAKLREAEEKKAEEKRAEEKRAEEKRIEELRKKELKAKKTGTKARTVKEKPLMEPDIKTEVKKTKASDTDKKKTEPKISESQRISKNQIIDARVDGDEHALSFRKIDWDYFSTMGVVGAFAGAMLGLFIWVIAYEMETKLNGVNSVMEFAAIILPVCSFLAYYKFGGGLDRRGIIITWIIICLMLYFAFNLTLAMDICEKDLSNGGNLGIIGGFKNISTVLNHNLDGKEAYIKTLVGSFLLTIIGGILTIFILMKREDENL